MIREAIQDLTEQDVDWLSSLQDSLSRPLPPPSPPTAQLKRKPQDQPGPVQRRVRTASRDTVQREPSHRSTRSNTATSNHTAPVQAQETPPPSPLAASHGHLIVLSHNSRGHSRGSMAQHSTRASWPA
jgi:hypothetical protein